MELGESQEEEREHLEVQTNDNKNTQVEKQKRIGGKPAGQIATNIQLKNIHGVNE